MKSSSITEKKHRRDAQTSPPQEGHIPVRHRTLEHLVDTIEDDQGEQHVMVQHKHATAPQLVQEKACEILRHARDEEIAVDAVVLSRCASACKASLR